VVLLLLAATSALLAMTVHARNREPGVKSGVVSAGPTEEPQTDATDVSQDRLMETLRSLPANRSAWGPNANRAALLQTEELVLATLKGFGYSVTEQPFEAPIPKKRWRSPGAGAIPEAPHVDEPETVKTRNFIVDIAGTEHPNEVLLVGAHFDSVDNTPGADDNGTGTAALLELARTLHDSKPRRTVRLVFFSLEETGLFGAKHYLREWKASPAAERIIGMMSLEMIGYFSTEEGSQATPPGLEKLAAGLKLPTVGDFLAITGLQKHRHFSGPLADAMAVAVPELPLLRADFFPFPIPDLYRSDHAPFMMADIPAVMITDTSNYRNPNYHKPTDTPETIDAARFTLAVKGIRAAVVTLAESGIVNPPSGPEQPEVPLADPEKGE